MNVFGRSLLVLTLLAGTCVLSAARADEPGQATPGAAEFGKLLPRVPHLSARESLALTRVQDGFRLEPVASEPLVRDPVALEVDERGRMYVVQLPPYNAYAVEGAKPRGSIVLLEDRDGDGRYDHGQTFADGLAYPTALACWDGGLFVGDAPDLLYLKDRDGDGRADQRKVVMSGFGSDKAGEAHLNSIRWGIDQRFHFSTSLSGGEVVAAAADPGRPVSVRGRGVSFDPRDWTRFELTSGGGQHGMSMDDWGRKFVCANSVPAQTLMYDDRYAARNPQLQAPAPAVDIAPEGKFTRLFRISPPEPWRALRTRLRREGKFRGSAEGGKPFGFFTGATGVTIYRGDAWPAAYRGNLLVGDVANNLVYRARLETSGLQPVARRADPGREFVASQDIWFRPVQFAHGPDGNLYVIDMYRELIEGAAFLPPEFFAHLDALSGNDRGRIYRLRWKQTPLRKAPRLDGASIQELVEVLEHANGWHRDTASRLLVQRADRAAVQPLRDLGRKSDRPQTRATAWYLLRALDALTEADVLGALEDPQPEVRVQALRLAESFAARSPAIRAAMGERIDDASLQVRYQTAFSLGSWGAARRVEPLLKLLGRDGASRWMRLAILSSLQQQGDEFFARLADDQKLRSTAAGRELLLTLAAQLGSRNRSSELATVLRALPRLATADKGLSEALVKALVDKQAPAARARTLAAAGGNAAKILEELLNEARRRAADPAAPLEERVEATRSLRLARFTEVRPLISDLLALSQPTPVQAAALDSLAAFDDPEVADLLLQVWSGLSPGLRVRAAETLLSRPAWIGRLLDGVEAGKVATSDLDPARVQLLRRHPSNAVAERARKLFANVRLAARRQVVSDYQQALRIPGDQQRGKQLFGKHCSACHRLEGVGKAVGAELRGIRARGLSAVLLNILDPNREVKPKFLTYVLQTDDGRVLTGMIGRESANSLTLRRSDGTVVDVQRAAIEDMRSTGLSFMPEGLEKSLDVQQMADLLSYLDTID